MGELHDMVKRSTLESLVAYIMYDSGSTKERITTYEREVNNSYERIFSRLEAMFPSADRHDDKFFGTILDFATIHEEVFFEMGMLIGYNICGDLNSSSSKIKTPEFQKMILEWLVSRNNSAK